MFRKVEQDGQIKFTNHSPGDYTVEQNPKRQNLPDVKRMVVSPVVNGLKVKLRTPPERTTKFDIVERPQGYQARTPTPRTLTDLRPMVQVSDMLQSARLDKLTIDAPDKSNTIFWREYNDWTDNTRIQVILQAIALAGQINLVPIEINPSAISRWDWAVWFLSAMISHRMIKKYRQTSVQLLRLFFTSANAMDVAQMTAFSGPHVLRGWVFDEFSIVKQACFQLELPRDPESYGFPAPYIVLPQEFMNKMLEILLYLTANAHTDRPDYVSSYNGTLLNFSEVKTLMTQPTKQLNMKTRQIEENPRGPAPTPVAPKRERDGPPPLIAPGAEGFEMDARLAQEGEMMVLDPDYTPANARPFNPAVTITPHFVGTLTAARASDDFYPWETALETQIKTDVPGWSADFEGREQLRSENEAKEVEWATLLFQFRGDAMRYYEMCGIHGTAQLRNKIATIFNNIQVTDANLLRLAALQALFSSESTPPRIGEPSDPDDWSPFPYDALIDRLSNAPVYVQVTNGWMSLALGYYTEGGGPFDAFVKFVTAQAPPRYTLNIQRPKVEPVRDAIEPGGSGVDDDGSGYDSPRPVRQRLAETLPVDRNQSSSSSTSSSSSSSASLAMPPPAARPQTTPLAQSMIEQSTPPPRRNAVSRPAGGLRRPVVITPRPRSARIEQQRRRNPNLP